MSSSPQYVPAIENLISNAIYELFYSVWILLIESIKTEILYHSRKPAENNISKEKLLRVFCTDNALHCISDLKRSRSDCENDNERNGRALESECCSPLEYHVGPRRSLLVRHQMSTIGPQTVHRRRVEHTREEERHRVREDGPGERVPPERRGRGLRVVQRHAPVHRVVRDVHELGEVEDHEEHDPTCAQPPRMFTHCI